MQAELHTSGDIQATLVAVGAISAVLASAGSLSAALAGVGGIGCSLSSAAGLSAELSLPKGKASSPFAGPYIYTPTQDTQSIPIADMKATEDIIINPIPSNYGLITWNGSTLTVS